MNFPANPTNGQVYQDYVYDSASGWRSQVMVGAAPCGSIMPFAGATIPAGWLLCDGAAVSRTTYSSLYAALGGISSPWGQGNGSTTFNLPDLRTRVPVGKNGSGTFSTLGAVGGAETMSLQEAHLAAHTHTFSGTTSNNGSHQHAPPVAVTYGGNAGNYRNLFTTNSPLWSGGDWNCAVTSGGAHDHTYSGTTSSKGSGQAFGLLQPYAVVNYIIKFAAVVAATDTELAVRMGQVEAAANAATAAVASKAPISSPTFTGYVTQSNQPRFQAYGASGTSGNNATDWVFPSTYVNNGNHYNTSNGRFTAPVAGSYMFMWSNIGNTQNTVYRYSLKKNGVQVDDVHLRLDTGNTAYKPNGDRNYILNLAAGDYVNIYYYSDNATASYTLGQYPSFAGYLIG